MACSRMEEGRRTFKILIVKVITKRFIGRPSLLWEDNIRVDLKEIDVYFRN